MRALRRAVYLRVGNKDSLRGKRGYRMCRATVQRTRRFGPGRGRWDDNGATGRVQVDTMYQVRDRSVLRARVVYGNISRRVLRVLGWLFGCRLWHGA